MLQIKSGNYVSAFLHFETFSLPHHRMAVLPAGAKAADFLHL
jgi:hypothetical protein